MILWLASYPKSGNTWLRIFIEAALFSKENAVDINNMKIKQFPSRSDFDELNIDIENVKEFSENCINAQEIINLDNKTKIFKTHNAFWKTGTHSFTNKKNTLGVIHIVRDPRNVITSVKNHYGKESYDEAFKFITDEKLIIGSRSKESENHIPTVVSSWSNHYNSWKKMDKDYLLIKYENLLSDPFSEFQKIINYLKKYFDFDFTTNQIKKFVQNYNFENLKKQESEKGFKESVKDDIGGVKKFFFLGPKNKWETMLDLKTRKDIEEVFEKEMFELGYL